MSLVLAYAGACDRDLSRYRHQHTDTAVKINRGMKFNGSTSVRKVDSDDTIKFATGNFTILIVLKPLSLPGASTYEHFVEKGSSYGITTYGSVLKASVNTGSYWGATTHTMLVGRKDFIVMTWNGTYHDVYANGNRVYHSLGYSPNASDFNLGIGANYSGGALHSHMIMYKIALYNNAWSKGDIVSDYELHRNH